MANQKNIPLNQKAPFLNNPWDILILNNPQIGFCFDK